MSSRHGLSARANRRITRHSTASTKAINVKPPLYRGGIRF